MLRSTLRDFQREYASDASSSASEGLETAQNEALGQFIQPKTDVDLVRTQSAISRHVLLRYHAQLDKMAQRFPCDGDASHVRASLALQFTWNDSFCPRKKSTQTGMSFERCAVVFNVRALESQLGVQTDRSTAKGLKTACRHFMRAAGAFAEVKDTLVERTLGARTPDMSAEGLGLLPFLMLSQAQACFYEKAIKDQMKDAIKAKLVHQALDYYVSALEFCRSSALAAAIDRSWRVHLQFQVHCIRAATQYWQGPRRSRWNGVKDMERKSRDLLLRMQSAMKRAKWQRRINYRNHCCSLRGHCSAWCVNILTQQGKITQIFRAADGRQSCDGEAIAFICG